MSKLGEYLTQSTAKLREQTLLKPLSEADRTSRREALGITPRTSIGYEFFDQGEGREGNSVKVAYHATDVGHVLLDAAARLAHDGTEVRTSRYQPALSMPKGCHRVSVTKHGIKDSRPDLRSFTSTSQVLVDLVDGVQTLPKFSPRRKTLRAVRNIRAGQQG